MSNQNKKWRTYFGVWRKIRCDSSISDFDFRLLKEIEDCQGANTHTWVSQETLAKRLGKSREWINKRIKFLRKKGLLKVLEKRHNKTLKIALKCELRFTPHVNSTSQDTVNDNSHNRIPYTVSQLPYASRTSSFQSLRNESSLDKSLTLLAEQELSERMSRGYKVKNKDAILKAMISDYKEILPLVEVHSRLSQFSTCVGDNYRQYCRVSDKLENYDKQRVKRLKNFLKGRNC